MMTQEKLFDFTPPVRRAHGKTRSTGEAFKLLKERRRKLIKRGREKAKTFAKKHGVVTSCDVIEAMKSEMPADIRPLWVGQVFNKEFRWNGDYYTYSDSERNIHECTVKVWELAKKDEQ